MQPIARFSILALCLLLAPRTALATVAGNLVVTVIDAGRQPVPNVDVVLDGGKQFNAKTDQKGQASFNGVPVDTYELTISLNGKPQVALTVSVVPERTQIYTIPLRDPASAPPIQTPPPKPVHASLVTAYNTTYPLYTADRHFGRYTYVLLFGSDAANRSLLMSLAQADRNNENTGAGPVLGVDNPLGYNLFAIPLNDKLRGTGDASVDWILANYNEDEAKDIRSRYCSARNHGSRSLCGRAWDSGPILMTFLHPLDAHRTNAPLPPALAYDLSRVPVSQMDVCVRQLSKAIVGPDDIRGDHTLTPLLAAKFVAPVMDAITNGLENALPQVEIAKDADFERSTNGIPRAAVSSESGAASPRP